jgi:hypothetical protein
MTRLRLSIDHLHLPPGTSAADIAAFRQELGARIARDPGLAARVQSAASVRIAPPAPGQSLAQAFLSGLPKGRHR